MNKELTRGYGPKGLLGQGNPGGLILGAHLSVAGGLERALTDAAALGCDCVQIFVKNQRQWRAAPLGEEQIVRFRAARSATHVAPVVAHASYLLNLASPDEHARQRSIDAISDELQRCEALGVAYLVFHPGAHLNGETTEPRSHEGKQQHAIRTPSASAGTPPVARAPGSDRVRCDACGDRADCAVA